MRLLTTALLSAALPLAAIAAETQSWDVSGYAAFAAGELDGLRVGRDGALRIGPAVQPLAEIPAPAIWALTVIGDTLYVATGHGGAVYKVDSSGQVTQHWKAPEAEVFCLTPGPDGALYAGTSPRGKIYRIDTGGASSVYFDPQQEYIWSLAFTAGALYAGTGAEGKLFRITAANTGAVAFDSGQRHVISLLAKPDGALLAGTDPNGVLYRVDPTGKAFALYDGNLTEVRSLASAAGRDYALLVTDTVTPSLQAVAAAQRQIATAAGGTATTDSGVTISTTPSAGPVVTYAGVDKSALVEVAADGSALEVWTSTEDTVLGMLPIAGAEPALRVVSATKGRVYDIRPDLPATLVAETGQQQATAIAQFAGDTIVATSNAGRLFRIASKPASSGTLTTPVYDAGRVAQWGNLHWDGERGGGSVAIQTRSGNTNQPGAGWSEWTPWSDTPGGGILVTSPPARYLQWRLRLSAGESSEPVVRAINMRYLPRNGAPRVFSVTVSQQKPEDTSTASSSSSSSSGAAFSITVTDTADGAAAVTSGNSTETIAATKETKLKIGWSAGDEDGDELDAKVYFRGDGEAAWKPIDRKPEKDSILLDNDVLADGRYVFKVVVSDSPSNPPDRVRQAEQVSSPYLLDRTPPTVRLAGTPSRTAVTFEATDAASALHSAAYSVDAGAWVPVLSADQILDSRNERIVLSLPALTPGEHLVTLRVKDEAGNTGLAKAILH